MEKHESKTSIVTTRIASKKIEILKSAARGEKRTLSNYLSLILEDHADFLVEKAELEKSNRSKAA